MVLFDPGQSSDPTAFEPADPAHFGVFVQVLIGDVGSDTADAFEIMVCSPSWFAAECEANRPVGQGGPLGLPEAVEVGAGFWFMRSWDRSEFEAAVQFLCDTYSLGPDWGSVAARIGRQIPWEFDFMRDAHVDERFGQPFPAAGIDESERARRRIRSTGLT